MSSVLVDTSVWLEFFKSKDSTYSMAIDNLLNERLVCTCNLIKAEIVPGAKNKRELQRLKDYFSILPLAQEPLSLWDDIINFRFQLNMEGIYGMSIPDLIIAVVALRNEKIVFTKDDHFKLIAKVIPIELYSIKTN